MSRAEELAYNKEMLKLWQDAERAVAGGQSYTVAGRTLTRVDADTILNRIGYYQNKIRLLEKRRSGGIRLQRVHTLDY